MLAACAAAAGACRANAPTPCCSPAAPEANAIQDLAHPRRPHLRDRLGRAARSRRRRSANTRRGTRTSWSARRPDRRLRIQRRRRRRPGQGRRRASRSRSRCAAAPAATRWSAAPAADKLIGGSGRDRLIGREGDDVLYGGERQRRAVRRARRRRPARRLRRRTTSVGGPATDDRSRSGTRTPHAIG